MSTPRVAVLGAGPMGLGVAYQLARDGYRPVVFEADDRLGGMSATFDFEGLQLERYYHFHCATDSAFLEMLDELGLGDRMRWVDTTMGCWYAGRLQPWGNPVALLRFRGLGLAAKLRYGLHIFSSIRRDDWLALDGRDARDWVQRWVGREAYDVLWKSLFELKFHRFAGELSAAWIWSRIRRLGRSRESLLRERLGYLDGGSNTLLSALRAAIEDGGGEIRLRSRVSRVVHESGRVKGLEVGGALLPFDRVVSTVPIPFLPPLIPDLPQELLDRYRAIDNIAVVCVVARLKRQVSEHFWVNINDPQIDVPGFVEYSNLRKLGCHIVYMPFYLPADHPNFRDADEVFTGKLMRYLRTINALLSDDDFLAFRVHRYRHAQPICTPRFLQRLPDIQLPVQGLWAADTSYYYPEDRGVSESLGFGRMLARRAMA